MNEPVGATSALGIERVEWFSEGGENLTVRVTGRWRRRRPAWSAQPTLVIDAPGHKHRFPAMPEPPSLTGVAPGMWRISFAVPSALAPELRGGASVQFGGAVVPLPAAVENGAAHGPLPGSDGAASERASTDGAPSERASPDGAASERERLGLEHELIVRRTRAGPRVPSEPPAPAVAATVEELQGPAQAGAGLSTPGHRALLRALRAELDQRARAEAALRARLLDAETRMAARQLLARRTATTLLALRGELDGLRGAIGREREARRAAELRVSGLAVELERMRRRSQDAYESIAELRGIVERLRAGAPEPEPEPERERELGRAPDPVEAGPANPAAAAPTGAPPGSEPAVRLSEALVRLRDGIPPLDGRVEGGAPTHEGETAAELPAALRPWLRSAIAALTRTDPDRAGRLIVDLLPAQRVADPRPVAYDLVLGDELGCVCVTVDDAGSRVAVQPSPRPSGEVDFQLFGDYAAIARLLTAGRLRRRLRLGVARVRGQRKRLAGMDSLLDVRLGLPELYDAGLRMQPRSALALLARLVEPARGDGTRFALAYDSPPEKIVYLVAGGDGPVQVTETAPAGGIATTISGPAGTLERVLAGVGPLDKLVIGEDWPLTCLRESIKRAQSA